MPTSTIILLILGSFALVFSLVSSILSLLIRNKMTKISDEITEIVQSAMHDSNRIQAASMANLAKEVNAILSSEISHIQNSIKRMDQQRDDFFLQFSRRIDGHIAGLSNIISDFTVENTKNQADLQRIKNEINKTFLDLKLELRDEIMDSEDRNAKVLKENVAKTEEMAEDIKETVAEALDFLLEEIKKPLSLH